MTEQDLRTLTERFLSAETTLAEEQQLYERFRLGDVPADLQPLRETFLAFAAVDGIDRPAPAVGTPAWLVALRAVTTLAAVFLLGLWVSLQRPAPADTQQPQPLSACEPPALPCLAEATTPRECYACYVEQRRTRRNTYQQLKQKFYEDQ